VLFFFALTRGTACQSHLFSKRGILYLPGTANLSPGLTCSPGPRHSATLHSLHLLGCENFISPYLRSFLKVSWNWKSPKEEQMSDANTINTQMLWHATSNLNIRGRRTHFREYDIDQSLPTVYRANNLTQTKAFHADEQGA
jgi:hypothetical protein